MSAQPNYCPLSLEDLLAGEEILKAPLGYCPQIDRETRMILRALLDDLFNHLHCWHDPQKCEEAFLNALFMHDILSDVLNRTPENTKVPETLEWLKPIKATQQHPEKEKTTMSLDHHLDFDDIDHLLSPVFELDLDKLPHSVLVHLEGQIQIMLGMVRRRYDEPDEE